MPYLRVLALFLAVLAGPAAAAYGWNSGAGCHAVAADAANERCTAFQVGLPAGSSSGVAQWCHQTSNFIGACGNTPSAGSRCTFTATLNVLGSSSSETSTKTTTMAVFGCDLGDSLPDKITDMSLLWGLFFGGAIAVMILRKLAGIWERSPHGDS